MLDDPCEPGPAQAALARTPRAVSWTRGPFRSIQVNVDDQGNNIMWDAANEPSLAIDPTDPNKMVIGWRQFDSVLSNFRQAGWAYSHDAGQTWTFPGVLEADVFRSDPVVAADADGNVYFYSLTEGHACDLFKSLDGGGSWQAGVPAFGGDKAWMAIDRTDGIGRGNIYCAWNRSRSCCPGAFTRSTDGGVSFSEPVEVPGDPYWGTVAVGPDGEVYVAGRDSSGSFLVAKSTNAQDPDATVSFDFVVTVDLGGSPVISGGPNPSGLLGQVWTVCDHSETPTRGNVYLLCSASPPSSDPLDVMFARSTDGGLTWDPPVRINDDLEETSFYQWFGTMSVAPDGRIDVVWNDTRNNLFSNFSELYFSYSLDGGLTWTRNIAVSPLFDHFLGYPNQFKLGDYYDMTSDDFGASVAYAATFNGEQDVYFLRIMLDCNGNGILDPEDIGGGTSADCNDNGVPDECDIGDDPSADCDADGVPDECEADSDGDETIDACDDCPQEPALTAPSEPDVELTCNDDIDNDCDGWTDLLDVDCPCLCGDVDRDGGVHLSDFVTFARCFGLTLPTEQCSTQDWYCSDLDGDGEVTLADFVTFAHLFGQPASGSPPDCG